MLLRPPHWDSRPLFDRSMPPQCPTKGDQTYCTNVPTHVVSRTALYQYTCSKNLHHCACTNVPTHVVSRTAVVLVLVPMNLHHVLAPLCAPSLLQSLNSQTIELSWTRTSQERKSSIRCLCFSIFEHANSSSLQDCQLQAACFITKCRYLAVVLQVLSC